MPLDEADLKLLEDKFFKPFKDSNDLLKSKLEDLERNQIPGMINRLVAKHTEKQPEPKKEPEGAPTKPADKNSEAWQSEVAALRKEIEGKEIKALVATALSRHKIVKGAEEDVIGGVIPLITKDEKGQFGAKIKTKLPTSGQETEEFVGVEGVVGNFLANKPWYRGSSESGGSGASGGSGVKILPTSWNQLKDNPKLVGELSKENPELLKKLQDEHNASLTQKR